MIKLRPKTLIFLSGAIPFTAGFSLIQLGFGFLVTASREAEIFPQKSTPLLSLFSSLFGSTQTALFILILLACVLGYFKGRFIISKSTKKNIVRILALPQPITLFQLYSPPYYILVSGMIALGFIMKVFSVPIDLRGLMDAAVGFALIEGSLTAFRMGWKNHNKLGRSP